MEVELRGHKFRIVLEPSILRFFDLAGAAPAQIGHAKFEIRGSMAQFYAEFNHDSSRMAEELGHHAEEFFKQHHSQVKRLQGHRIVFRGGKLGPKARQHKETPAPRFKRPAPGVPRPPRRPKR